MPKVPYSNNVVPFKGQGIAPSQVDPTYLAMAAAIMHEQGRLVEPKPVETKDKDGNAKL